MNNPMHAKRPHARHTDAELLAGRLAVGWTMCERETDPARKQQLESHWLAVLHAYEEASEQSVATAEPGPQQEATGCLT